MIVNNKKNTGQYKRGFTLLELSIVLLVLAVMAGGLLTILSQNARTARNADLVRKMDAIENALLAFRKANNRIPCPADGTLLITSQYFGIEGVNPGACTTGATYDGNFNRTAGAVLPTANFAGAQDVVAGVVPTKTLGLPDDYMFDPWGGRFRYEVDFRATATNAFSSYLVNSTQASPGGILVYDTSSNLITSLAVAAVISHGPNGHGAFQLSGVVKSSGSDNSMEMGNCGCNSATPPVSGGGAGKFSQAIYIGPNKSSSSDPLNSFDDTVRYYTRSTLSSSTDLLTETR